jgi:hypothetical protein
MSMYRFLSSCSFLVSLIKNTPIDDLTKRRRTRMSSTSLRELKKGKQSPPARPAVKHRYQLKALDSVGNYSRVAIVRLIDRI